MARITVVLPVFNGANYLQESIVSVLGQDFTDFELHVLDDGSEDESPKIARSTGDGRVRYSRNPARFGLFKTLNRGFEEATTPLVRIWAHDDRMTSGSLGKFVAFASAHPGAGMVYSDFVAIDATGERTDRERTYAEQRTRTPEIAGSQLSALLFWCYGCLPGNISTVLLRREAWEATGGFWTGAQQAPDFDMWVRVSERCEVGFIRERLVELRDHPLQLARVGQKQMTTIEEELVVVEQLRHRLAGVLTEHQLRDWWVNGRGAQHAHWVARALLRRDFSAALRGYHAMARYGQPWRQLAFWLFSGNRRWFTPSPDTLFDAKAALCSRDAQRA